MSCNVIIIDDHPLFSRGLSQLIETQKDYKVIGMAKDRNEALSLLDSTTPDLAIVDLNLGQEDGLELIKDIIIIHPQTKILVLSMHDERFYAERAIKAGAKGYIMKEEAESQVINAIKTVNSGEIYLSENEKKRIKELSQGQTSSGELSDLISTLSDDKDILVYRNPLWVNTHGTKCQVYQMYGKIHLIQIFLNASR